MSLTIAAQEKILNIGAITPLHSEREQLAELKSEAFEKWKRQAMDTSEEHGKRAGAVMRISELGSDDAARFLAELWENPLNVSRHEKLNIIDWAGKYGSDACIPMLEKALLHQTDLHRWYAARALLQIQGTDVVPRMRELAKKDESKIVRKETRRSIGEAIRRERNLSNYRSIVREVAAWGRSQSSGPYIEEEIIYLLKETRSPDIENGTLRLYSSRELELLGKFNDAYEIRVLRIGGRGATVRLKTVAEPPIDPVPFPYSGWTLNLKKLKSGQWTIFKAMKKIVK